MQQCSAVAGKTMNDVFNGIWERIIPYDARLLNIGKGGTGAAGGVFPPVESVIAGSVSGSPKPPGRRRGSVVHGGDMTSFNAGMNAAAAEQRDRNSGIRSTVAKPIGLNMMNSSLVDVNSLWLSPAQLQLEKVMSGLIRIDNVFQHVQHVASVSSTGLKELRRTNDSMSVKYHHLSEWSEKETMRKSGMTDFNCQFNSNLKDPREGGNQTDVTWLQRVPQVNNTSTGNEKIVTPMNTRYRDLEDNVMSGVRHMTTHDDSSGGSGKKNTMRITTKGNGEAVFGGDTRLARQRGVSVGEELEGMLEEEEVLGGAEGGMIDRVAKASEIMHSPTASSTGTGETRSPNKPRFPNSTNRGRTFGGSSSPWNKAKNVVRSFGGGGGGRDRSQSPQPSGGGANRGARMATQISNEAKRGKTLAAVSPKVDMPSPNYRR